MRVHCYPVQLHVGQSDMSDEGWLLVRLSDIQLCRFILGIGFQAGFGCKLRVIED